MLRGNIAEAGKSELIQVKRRYFSAATKVEVVNATPVVQTAAIDPDQIFRGEAFLVCRKMRGSPPRNTFGAIRGV